MICSIAAHVSGVTVAVLLAAEKAPQNPEVMGLN